jgi:hypothetical protein
LKVNQESAPVKKLFIPLPFVYLSIISWCVLLVTSRS